MAYRVEFKPSAASQVRKLQRDAQRRVRERVRGLGENPRPHGVKKLQSEVDLYRIRVGDYRVIYTISDAQLLVVIQVVADRKDAYD